MKVPKASLRAAVGHVERCNPASDGSMETRGVLMMVRQHVN